MLDKLFVNGNIYTMASEGDRLSALGVKDGIIAYAAETVPEKLPDAAELIDLKGQTMIPGMGDSHQHLYAYCQNLTFVDLSGVRSVDEMIGAMKARADEMPEGGWIKGVNFDQTKWKENRFPTLEEMDRISRTHPVVIKRTCLHCVVANSKGLEIVGVGRGYKSDGGGLVELDENGYPNGILREQSTKVFDDVMPDPLKDPNVQKEIISRVFRDMSSRGITTIHTYAAKIWQYNESIDIYRDFERRGELPVRVTVCIDELFEPEKLTEEQRKDPYRKAQLGAYKIFSDGSLGSRSAALREPYADDPGNSGFVLCTQEELNEKVCTGYRKGLQPAIHAIGDRALDMTVSAIEYTLKKTAEEGMSREEQEKRLPFRIIHAQLADQEQIARMAKLPLIADMQPIFLQTDLHWMEERVGKERLSQNFPMKSMLDAGIIMTGGSDCPVETYDPIQGMATAVTRTDPNGYPQGGYIPQEKLSVYDALCLYTKNMPFATGQEEVLGTLEEGKFADLAVLDRNPFDTPEEHLREIRVMQTYIAGERVFDRVE